MMTVKTFKTWALSSMLGVCLSTAAWATASQGNAGSVQRPSAAVQGKSQKQPAAGPSDQASKMKTARPPASTNSPASGGQGRVGRKASRAQGPPVHPGPRTGEPGNAMPRAGNRAPGPKNPRGPQSKQANQSKRGPAANQGARAKQAGNANQRGAATKGGPATKAQAGTGAWAAQRAQVKAREAAAKARADARTAELERKQERHETRKSAVLALVARRRHESSEQAQALRDFIVARRQSITDDKAYRTISKRKSKAVPVSNWSFVSNRANAKISRFGGGRGGARGGRRR